MAGRSRGRLLPCETATATISPAGGRKGETRYRIVTRNGGVVSELRFSAISTSGVDGTGVYVQGCDASGLVSIEAHLDVTDQSGKVEFSFGDPTGREAAVEFAAGLSQPNRLQVAGKVGPFRYFRDIPEAEPPLPSFVARYVSSLAAVQPLTSTPIVVPDLTTVTGELAHRVLTAAELVDGQTIVGRWKAFEFETDGSVAIETGGHYQLATIEPLTVTVGEQALKLGATENILLSATLTDLGDRRLRAEPHLNDAGHQVFAPAEPTPQGGRAPVRSRPAPPE